LKRKYLFPVLTLILALVSCRFLSRRAPDSQKAITPSPALEMPTRPGADTACAQAGLPATVAYKTVAGVAPNLLSLDIYLPSPSCNAPVVMWIHGGGYAIGDKANQVADKARLFSQQGWIFVSANYRLTRPRQPAPAQFPDHYLDVAAAVAWVHAHIGDYGGDARRIALLGHSAGADIVSNVVVNPTYLEQNGLSLEAIVCAGPLDTEGFDKPTAGGDDPDGEKAQWKNALGNNPNYLTETSATLLIQPGIGIPPMIGMVRGDPGRQQIEMDFLARLASAGIPAATIDARLLTHQEVNTQIGAPGDTVMTQPVLAFLTECFK
jgi:arylformamidase